MVQQNDNGVTLPWLKKAAFQMGFPSTHTPPAASLQNLPIHYPHPHTTGAVTGTRAICECLGATVGIDPV